MSPAFPSPALLRLVNNICHGKVVCNVTDMYKEERELLMKRKEGKRKVEKDAVELIGKLPSWEAPLGLPPVLVAGESKPEKPPPNDSAR